MVRDARRNQTRVSATVIATENTLTDENNTPVSTDKTFEINLLKELEDQNLVVK